MKLSESRQTALACCLLLLPILAQAETRYVTDQLEITLRSGPGNSHAIQRMVASGSALTVLERDIDNGYSRVQTSGGIEGWVLSRFLIAEPSARRQLERLSSQLSNTKVEKGVSISAQVRAIRTAHDNVAKRIIELETDNKKLEDELEHIKHTATNVLAIDEQNKMFQQQLIDTEAKVRVLQQENYELNSNKERDWFVAGAIVLFSGLIIGLIMSRIQGRKRSRYSDF
ncbi:MAG: TIGR04211 family SH3 domain-containing protein [Nitrosomonas sp.]|nr:TIGR04211 family SH3 domain-containing protein [Nitrosomonas sp.]MDP1951402.1 TIGR04211 family SH3 domain-containing protein [Nitrosomonas sp.]